MDRALPLWHFAYSIFHSQLVWQRKSGDSGQFGGDSWDAIFRRKYAENQVYLWTSGATLCDQALVDTYHAFFQRLFTKLLGIPDLRVNLCSGGIAGVFFGDLLRMHADVARRLGRNDVVQVSIQLGRPGQEVRADNGEISVSVATPNPATHVDALGLLADYVIAPAIGDGGLDEIGRLLMWHKLREFGLAQPSWSGGVLLDLPVGFDAGTARVYEWFTNYGNVARRIGTITPDAHDQFPVFEATPEQIDVVAQLVERQLRARQNAVRHEAPIVLDALDAAIASAK